MVLLLNIENICVTIIKKTFIRSINMTIYDMIQKVVPRLEAEHKFSQIVCHNGSKGAIREFFLKEVIRPFLPKRYGLCNGECFDINDNVSKQLDIIIYDDLFSYAVSMGITL